MRFSLVVVGVIVQAAVCLGSAKASIADQLTMNLGSAEQQMVYLSGAASALTILNFQLPPQSRFFCPPLDYVLNAEEMQTLAAMALEGPHDPSNFIIAATSSLREQFPCR